MAAEDSATERSSQRIELDAAVEWARREREARHADGVLVLALRVLGGLVAAFGGLLVLQQDAIVLSYLLRRRTRTRGYSAAPLIGPGICAAGLALAGVRGWLLALPLALDVGTYSLVVGLPYLLVVLWRDRRRPAMEVVDPISEPRGGPKSGRGGDR